MPPLLLAGLCAPPAPPFRIAIWLCCTLLARIVDYPQHPACRDKTSASNPLSNPHACHASPTPLLQAFIAWKDHVAHRQVLRQRLASAASGGELGPLPCQPSIHRQLHEGRSRVRVEFLGSRAEMQSLKRALHRLAPSLRCA